MIPAGAIFIWTSTNATIPSGWSRVTALDDKYPKGTAASTDPGTTGGATTHTHTATGSHTHAIDAHTHTITLPNASGNTDDSDSNITGDRSDHNHGTFNSGAVNSDSVSTETPSYGSVSNNPPYYTVIFCTPNSDIATDILPDGMVMLSDIEIVDFLLCDGASGTPNLVDKFLLGASSGANAGGTGGSVTNIHALSHVHTTSHGHAGINSPQATNGARTQSGTAVAWWGHVHTNVVLNAATPSTADTVTLTTSETVEPAYTKLLAIQADGNVVIKKGAVALWRGLLADIPSGWELMDGTDNVDMRGQHLKITTTPGNIGNTGGSNTHTHASQSHTHGITHTHTSPSRSHANDGSTTGNFSDDRGSGVGITGSGTTHASSTSGSTAATLASGNSAANSSNNEPPYSTVAFIRYLGQVTTDNFFLMF